MIDFHKLLENSTDELVTISILADMQDRKIIEDVVQDGKIWIKIINEEENCLKVLKELQKDFED